MNKDIIAIYVGQLYFQPDKMHKWDERNLITGGIGGSEIWAIQIASQFEQMGYHCMVFADCETWHFADDGVEYIPFLNFNICAKFNHFSAFISSRRMDEVPYACLTSDVNILMFHDPFLIHDYDEKTFNKFDYFMYQSDYQKRLLINNYPSLENRTWVKTFQAIDMSKYITTEKKNKMLWSSHKIRGSKFLIEKIFPLVKEQIHDFEIDVCGYADDMTDEYFKKEGINVLGNITKDELIRRQCESKIWVYPYTGMFENGRINDETFCITAIENAIAENAIIVPEAGCFATTLQTYNGYTGTELFNGQDTITEGLYDNYANIISNRIVELLTNDELRIQCAKNAKEICLKYTWENAAKTFTEIFNHLNNEPKYDLLLATAVMRNENLPEILESIEDGILKKGFANVSWLIVQDLSHNTEDISDFINGLDFYKEKYNFNYAFIKKDPGDNKPHYGGILFNDEIEAVLNTHFINKDPWIYILDDDNKIGPLFAEALPKMLKAGNVSGKRLVLSNIRYESSISGMYNTAVLKTLHLIAKNYGHLTPWNLTLDPSQALLKASLWHDIGRFTNIPTFDIDIHDRIFSSMVEEVICNDDYDEINTGNMHTWTTTHNYIPSKKHIAKMYETINSKNAKEFTLVTSDVKNGSLEVHIPEEAAREIMDKYIKK